MNRSQDLLQSQHGWIHELTRAEIHPEAEKLLQLGKSFDPQQLVEESAIDFLAELRGQFSEFARAFNSYSENGASFSEIKVYSVAQTAADFMLFRNQVKLIFSNSSHGVIQISFAQHMRGSLAIDGVGTGGTEPRPVSGAFPGFSLGGQAQELLAQVGPFRDVFWTFQGEKVFPEQISKFYFVEFAKVTRVAKKLPPGNQLLLDQIKALLQEKGLDF
jgi:hypothetical protein